MTMEPELKEAPKRDAVLLLLRMAASTVFLGRGILYLSDHAPLSTFFWHQGWLEKPLLNWFGMEWEHYAATSEPLILGTQSALGFLFLVCAVICWWVGPGGRKWPVITILIGMVGLIPYWLLRWVDKDFQSGMFLEHFLQWGTPLLLALYGRMEHKKWLAMSGVFVSFTFIGHGQYAIGLGVPHDNEYVNMTIRLLGVEEGGARLFLRTVGWIDVALPALFLIPKTRVPALGYAAFWGLVTALSRIPSHFTRAEDWYGLHPWTAEAVVRLTHGLAPLVMLLLILRIRRKPEEPEPEIQS